MSLALDYDALLKRVGHFLGYQGLEDDPNDLTDAQFADVDTAVDDGLRLFYASWRWSFLRPIVPLITASGVAEYPLPEEYAGIWGPITIRSTSSIYPPIHVINESAMRMLGQIASGVPCKAAIVPLEPTGITGQGHRITFYPVPDAEYTLEVRMLANPQTLSDDNPHPYGGAQYSRAILAACLAAAETTFSDMKGAKQEEYQQALAQAIETDKQQSRGEHLGLNGDPSTPEARLFNSGRGYGPHLLQDQRATVNGVQY